MAGEFRVAQAESWSVLGEKGEEEVRRHVPDGFYSFQNILLRCCHGNDFEEIDLIVVGETGIWCVEIKNWRGIAYPTYDRDSIDVVRRTPNGPRNSQRFNPYYQVKRHCQDLHDCLSYLKIWFPPIRSLVVFASRDKDGIEGVNLDRIRGENLSLIYLEELTQTLLDSGKRICAWGGTELMGKVLEALGRQRTWTRLRLIDGRQMQGIVFHESPGFPVTIDSQLVNIDWGDVYRMEFGLRGEEITARLDLTSGEVKRGRPQQDRIRIRNRDGMGVEDVRVDKIAEMHTGFPRLRVAKG